MITGKARKTQEVCGSITDAVKTLEKSLLLNSIRAKANTHDHGPNETYENAFRHVSQA